MVKKFRVDISEEKSVEVFYAIDEEGTGYISYMNFSRAFFPEKIWTLKELRSHKSSSGAGLVTFPSKSSSAAPSTNESIQILVESLLRPTIEQVEKSLLLRSNTLQ